MIILRRCLKGTSQKGGHLPRQERTSNRVVNTVDVPRNVAGILSS